MRPVARAKHPRNAHATPSPYGEDMGASSTHRHVVVVGAGMVAHRFVESMLSRDDGSWRVSVVGDEGRPPYDRVSLTSFLEGATATDLTLPPSTFEADPRVTFLAGDPVVRIDTEGRTATTRSGARLTWD